MSTIAVISCFSPHHAGFEFYNGDDGMTDIIMRAMENNTIPRKKTTERQQDKLFSCFNVKGVDDNIKYYQL